MSDSHGGAIVAEVLERHGIRHLFALCGGHISPILVGAKQRGIEVVDVRDEAAAVFAADAVARLTGFPGVAAVTAGPGVTNALTAIKNAQMAQTPLLVLGGATATVLKGRGALQDIDQISLVQSAVKWSAKVSTVPSLGPIVDKALRIAQQGVPGPVFVEVPVDVLYPESLVREWYIEESGVKKSKSLGARALGLYLEGHLYRQFHLPQGVAVDVGLPELRVPFASDAQRAVRETAQLLRGARRPALVVGSQTVVGCRDPEPLARAIERLGIPVWLGGGARGLLGRHHPIQFRHARGASLKEADVVLVAGFPFDFRLKYGLAIGAKAKVVTANLSARELRKNRRPRIAAHVHPRDFLVRLAEAMGGPASWDDWFDKVRAREAARDAEIAAQARSDGELVDPLHFFLRLEEKMADDAIIVADGGDFVATAAYTLRPRAPLSWLDPGVFGTLGVGGGFAVGAATVRPGTEVWIVYGDGSCAYSLAEIDTCVRHGLCPIAVIGTDASWAQIARDQVTILGDDVGTSLLRTAYHVVAEGYGGVGLLLDDPKKTDEVLDRAKEIARGGKPVVVNVHIAPSEFRKGSISI